MGDSSIIGEASRMRRGPRACARGPPPVPALRAQRWERNGDVLVPPVHADGAFGPRGAGWKLVEIGLLELLAGLEEDLAGVVLEGTGEDVEPIGGAGQELGEEVLD